MHPGPDPLGAPPSFAARRPNAPNHFELPPPLGNSQKYNFAPYSQASQAPGSVASVGNLLTPPTNIPGDGLSPVSSIGATTATTASQQTAAPYSSNGYAWSPHNQGAQYGFQAGANQPTFSSHRPLFSPSLNAQRQGNASSPATSEGMQPPHYEVNLPPFPASGPPMSAPATMPSVPSQPHHYSNTQTPVSSSAPQPSPIHSQEGFPGPKPPPTPTYYGSQPSSTPQTYPYSTGPSPTQPQPSPLNPGAGMTTRMSPVSAGPVPSMPAPPSQSPHYQQRPFGQYPLPGGPVLSNINNPNGGLAVVGMPHSMMHGFNSGHAASMQHMYGASHPPPPQPPNDRPFRCDQCPQSFNRNHDLKRHKRIHLAVKPFPCGHCDKSFSRKDALKRHILVKGCGKTQASATEGEKQGQDGSAISDSKGAAADSSDHKPVSTTS